MKKKLLCILIALLMLLTVLTGCSDDEEDELGTDTKPVTITLYGITGETTTEEAILAVQDAINEYTENKFNTHIILRLYPEAEYYNEIETRLAAIEQKIADEEAEAKRLKEEAKKLAKEGKSTTKADDSTTEEETEAETYVSEDGSIKTVYPAEDGTQVDIFMVQGSSKLVDYYNNEWLSSLNDSLSGNSKVLSTYISAQLLALTTIGGTALDTGVVTKGTVYGIPNNAVYSGEYTYLLVNKEIAEANYYSESDVSTLSGLQYFLMDAAAQYPDYITLYNDPVLGLEYITDEACLVGGIITQGSNAFTRVVPRDLLTIPAYRNYRQYCYTWQHNGYTVNESYYEEPSDGRKFAAAFLKGDSTLGEQYEDEYYVIKYLNPIASADEVPGTMFCVSSFASNVDRCMEIITDLQTNSEFRNMFQYGVENVNYTYDEMTGNVVYLNDTYSMDPADTGNMFILKPNTSMSEQMLKLSENNWEQAKLELRETIFSPYAKFKFNIVTADNYKTTSTVYQTALNEAYEEAKANNKSLTLEEFEATFEYEYPYEFTDDILKNIVEVSKEFEKKIDEFEEYTDGDKTVTLTDFCKTLRIEFEKSTWYLAYSSAKNSDSPYAQYNTWFAENGPSDEIV